MNSQTIPDVASLRELVKRDETKYGKAPWISESFIIPHVAIHFTRVFLRLRWSGDHVTLLMTACAFLGPVLFFLGGTEGYVGGATFMLLSWILDNSDGQVRRFWGEDSNLSIYLDRFTHRVSYPLQHIGMGVSLFNLTGTASYLLFGGVVAYFYQLVVVHILDKQLIHIQRGGVDPDPLKTLRLRLTGRMPLLQWPLKILVGSYAQLIQNVSFVVLLILAALVGYVPEFYLGYGTLVVCNWALRTVLDYTVGFPWKKRYSAPYGSRAPERTQI